ncbi:SGNH/GDSL hydrolase family protein [Nocardioides sp. IC4_145]|uniref:SGNH/GDSL hydrolase family protein n=1 Tax=Nocardioides sp. IC4_145 TaxID=2714037 RepID=UPI00140DB678|nr:SGNH/GDSL hydrolase family protein [Nocardioides sp. IC4_145]NHC24021.1 SGNH/GDSL hydrolase family protein [Nocardioides sp. IC4_145]
MPSAPATIRSPRVRRLRAALASTAVLAATAAGTLTVAGPAPAASAPAASAAAGTRAVVDVDAEEPLDYVALGDSYSAGPLVPLLRLDPLGCIRSTANYPAYLARHLGAASYLDVTCSGAETADLTTRRQETIIPGPAPAPQVDVLTDETDLVTIGIGGNDYGLFGSMIEVCGEVAALAPNGAPCRRHFTNAKGVDTKVRDADRIRKDVEKVLRTVARRAPTAALVVVGYPRLLPAKGACSAVGFAKGDYAWGNKVERRLNRSLRLAAASNGATYVDLYPASRGHDACAGGQAWINGKTLNPLRAANFHPFGRGMRAMAQEVYRQLTDGRTASRRATPLRADDAVTRPLTPQRRAEVVDAWRRWSAAHD